VEGEITKKNKLILEHKLNNEDVNELNFLFKGIVALEDEARKLVFERKLDYIPYDEYVRLVYSQKFSKYPLKYAKELKRYKDMFLSKISNLFKDESLGKSTLGEILGTPYSNKSLFELKQKNKSVGFILLDKNKSKIEFIKDYTLLPKSIKDKFKTLSEKLS